MKSASYFLVLLAVAAGTHAIRFPRPSLPKIPRLKEPALVRSRNGTILPPYDTVYYFDQLIDHNDPSQGTFPQRYWHTYEYYEPGGPIILMTPGEVNADGYDFYLTDETMPGLIAKQQNGSTILLEHRFFGLSNPRDDLSEESLQLLTIEQAIEDFDYFTNNVVLPQPNGDQVQPGKAPWILIGGSYAGALTSWTMVNKPGLFYAGYASSAVVEAINYFWQYFEPIRQYMPQNCSADVQLVIEYVDSVLQGTDTSAIDSVKANWGMQSVEHLDDVAGALRNNLWTWQDLQPYSGPDQPFFQFCDALEVQDGVSAGPDGWGFDHAYTAWGNYWNSTYIEQLCGTESTEYCLNTYDSTASYYTSTAVDNADRSWQWIICNFLGFSQDGAPEGNATIVSRVVQPGYDIRRCSNFFPDTFSGGQAPNTAGTNAMYDGWDVSVDRLFFANGERDPWRFATLSSPSIPSSSSSSSTSQTQVVSLSDGFHCSDLLADSGADDQSVAEVQSEALGRMGGWLEGWVASG